MAEPERVIGFVFQPGEYLIQQVDDLLEGIRRVVGVVKQIRDHAEEIPEKVARPLSRGDRQIDLAEGVRDARAPGR